MLPRSAQVIKNSKENRFVAALFVSIGVAGGLFSLSACTARTRSVEVVYRDAEPAWREGDVVFRDGLGVESRAVVITSHGRYSHVGLLHRDSASKLWQVVHAVPGEDEPEYIKAEPVAMFFDSYRAQAGAWARIDCSDSVAAAAVRYALNKVAEHVLFDNDYLLEDTAQLYCTELIWRSYLSQGIDVSGGQRHGVLTLFSNEGECIFPDNIEKSSTTLFVKPLKTKEL